MPDLDSIAAALGAHGHDVLGGRIRVAASRSGIAVGFPRDPLIHLSWPALAAGAVALGSTRRLRSR